MGDMFKDFLLFFVNFDFNLNFIYWDENNHMFNYTLKAEKNSIVSVMDPLNYSNNTTAKCARVEQVKSLFKAL